MEGPPDWDLLAVVRSCSSTTTTTTSSTTSFASAARMDLQPLPPPPTPPQQQLYFSQAQQMMHQDTCFSTATPSTTTCSSTSSLLFGFSTPTTTTPTTSSSFLRSGHQELHDICKAMICTTTSSTINNNNNNNNMNNINSSSTSFQSLSCSPLTSPVSSSSSIITPGRSFGVVQQQPQLRRLIKPSQVIFGASSPTVTGSNTGGGTPQSQRTKKRKNLMKKVCHVPAEGLSSDNWAWRKYGQKPIKGSPYPRGYYRCSSSKGCLARKQVERNRSDPKMFIVTYTSEHNHPMPTHRNSLAGSTRQKPLSAAGTATTPPEQPTCSSPSAASLSPMTEKSESKTEVDDLMKDEEDNDMGGLSELMLNDDFYVGFEQIDAGSGDSDCFSDQFSPSTEFPWLSSSSSTATAAGGS